MPTTALRGKPPVDMEKYNGSTVHTDTYRSDNIIGSYS